MKGKKRRMKDIVESMIKHPIATVIVIGSVTRGIATIVATLKGNVIEPIVKVTTTQNYDRTDA